jgi:predicted metal-dependent hydrolase
MDGMSEVLSLPQGPTRVRWRRNARARRISLRIDPRGGAVVVTLPLRAGRAAGMALLMDHAAWVAARLAALPEAVAFATGNAVPIDGRMVQIHHVERARGVRLVGDALLVGGVAETLPRQVAEFMRAEARRRLSALATEKAHAIGLMPRRVVVKDTRSRWGSCAPDGTLMFCWRLLMAPAEVQDYVAAHEVAHLRHMNHGPHFWALVEDLSPHVEAAIAWLHESGAGLMRIG